MINKRILSTLLALAILLSCVGWTPAQAQGTAPIDAETPADQTSISTLPIEEEEDELPEREPIARLYGEEGDDLNKIVYLNNDGTRTMHLYDYPVKYRDASGEIHDISLEIADGTTELNRFQSSANSIMTAFPSKASDGISLSGEGVSIKLIPNIPEADTNTIHMTGNAKRIDSKTISYDYDAKTTIEYSLTYTGFKEDIVVSEYTGQTEYEFLLQTNGLALTQIDGSFYLTDESGKIKAAIGDVIVFTADEKNNTMGTMVAETLKENHSYLLTIVLDAQYLADPNTAYPIRIDPTIDINYDANGSGAIEDVTIYSNVTPDGASTSLFVGLRETRGISRILMRFPNLDLSGLTGATVESAEVTLRDLICEGTYLPVYCYPFTGANWTESTASWSMSQTWGPELDSEVISYSNGVNKNPKHRYTFNITAAVQGWINGTYSKTKGLIFKTSNAVETAATYEQRQFASYNRTNYRPTFTMTYVLPGSITAATNAVNQGVTLQLTAHMNGTVTWTSSDSTRATVSSTGVVTAKKAGQVTITATCADYTPATFTLWVKVANGVYRLQNQHSNFYLSVNADKLDRVHYATHQTLSTLSSDPVQYYAQLWKIEYLANGLYSIRPMYSLGCGLTASGTVAVSSDIGTVTSLTSIPPASQWTIQYDNGYIIQNAGLSNKTLLAPNNSTTNGQNMMLSSYTDSSISHLWNIVASEAISNTLLLIDLENGSLANSFAQYIAPGETLTLEDMGLSVSFVSESTNSQAFTWSSAGKVLVDIEANSITGSVPDSTTNVQFTIIHQGVIYTKSLDISVTSVYEGNYYIQNAYLQKYISYDSSSTSPAHGDAIVMNAFSNTSVQEWIVEHAGDGTYTIRISMPSQSLYIGVKNGTDSQNQPITLCSSPVDNGTKWLIERTENNAFTFTPVCSVDSNRVLAPASSDSLLDCNPIYLKNYYPATDISSEWLLKPLSIELTTPLIGQQTSMWCWAASAQMVARTLWPTDANHGSAHTIRTEQQDAVYHVYGNDSSNSNAYNWDQDPQNLKSKGGFYWDVGNAMAHLTASVNGDTTYVASLSPYTEEALLHFIVNGYPVARLFGWMRYDVSLTLTLEDLEEIISNLNPNDIGGHVTVIAGAEWNAAEQQYYYIVYDPGNGGFVDQLTYSELVFQVVATNNANTAEFWFPAASVQTNYSDLTFLQGALVITYSSDN